MGKEREGKDYMYRIWWKEKGKYLRREWSGGNGETTTHSGFIIPHSEPFEFHVSPSPSLLELLVSSLLVPSPFYSDKCWSLDFLHVYVLYIPTVHPSGVCLSPIHTHMRVSYGLK